MLSRSQRGLSLIEMMIALVVVAVLMMLALPEYNTFIKNAKIKNVAQSYEAGLQLARAEALRRNESVRFSLVTNMSSTCAVLNVAIGNTTAPGWVVSRDDPADKCDIAPSETVAPRIVQKWDAGESESGLPWFMYIGTAATGGGDSITFNGLGRVSPAFVAAGINANTGRIDVDVFQLSDLIRCEHGAGTGGVTLRCMRIVVTNAGQIRMCDPKVSDAADPRKCP